MKNTIQIIAKEFNNAAGLTDVMFTVVGKVSEIDPEKLGSKYYKHLCPDDETQELVSVSDSYRIKPSIAALGITKEMLSEMRKEWVEKNRPESEKIWARQCAAPDDDF